MAQAKPTRRECDLYAPIQSHLTAQGYTVRGEVKGCDITAIKDDELIVIELKRSFSTDLLIQATQRQKAADTVYVALPIEGKTEKRERYSKRWRGIEHLLRRLEIGLILVAFPEPESEAPKVEIVFQPASAPAKPRRNPKTRRAILREIAGRSGDYNVGGTTGQKQMTAYREQAIHIACYLDRDGPMTPCRLRALGCSPKAQNILFRDVYGWFERMGRGVYGLTPQGKVEIETYAELVAHYRRKMEAASPSVETGEAG